MPKVIKLKNNTFLFGTIIETIENENGTAIKFSDGTMICKNIVHLSLPGTSILYDILYYKECFAGWTEYPIPFIETPVVQLSLVGHGTVIFIQQADNGNKNVPDGFYYYSTKNITTNQVFDISYIAIGKWK